MHDSFCIAHPYECDQLHRNSILWHNPQQQSDESFLWPRQGQIKILCPWAANCMCPSELEVSIRGNAVAAKHEENLFMKHKKCWLDMRRENLVERVLGSNLVCVSGVGHCRVLVEGSGFASQSCVGRRWRLPHLSAEFNNNGTVVACEITRSSKDPVFHRARRKKKER